LGLIRTIASWSLLGIFLMPSPRILDPERTHSRHATCEHHLRRHHPDPVDRARILRRAERRKRRNEEEGARLAQERLGTGQERLERARAAIVAAQATADERDDAEAAAQLAEALDESNLQPCQAAADPQDDDSDMKKGRRPAKIKTLFWSLQEPPRIRAAGEFLAMLRAHLEPDRVLSLSVADALPHYGSGPCHSIPRPREGTVLPCLPLRGVAAV
jgi:hypothetical protein